MQIVRTLGALGAIALSGCTAAQVYSDPDLTKLESVPVYPARAILVPEGIGADGRPLAAKVGYVPDRSRPLYIRQIAGTGSGGFIVDCDDTSFAYKGFEQKKVGPNPDDVVTKLGAAAVTVIGAREILRETNVLKDK